MVSENVSIKGLNFNFLSFNSFITLPMLFMSH